MAESETLPYPVETFLRSIILELQDILNQIQQRLKFKVNVSSHYFNTIYNIFHPMYQRINWKYIKNSVVEEIFKEYMGIYHDMTIYRYQIQKQEYSKTSLPVAITEISDRDRYKYSSL